MALEDKAYYDYYYDLIIKLKNVKSCVEEIKQEVINDNTIENFEFIKKSRVKEIIDEATGFSSARKLNWSGVCAVSDNRNQCSEENCILFPICKIKKKKEVEK